MSEQATSHAGHGTDGHDSDGHDHAHGPEHYVKIWLLLLALLALSVAGPFLEIQVITLLTAFGIAVVKASLVVKYFMHLDVQPKYVMYFLATSLAFMVLFFFGIAPDVLHHEGQNWVNMAAEEEIVRAFTARRDAIDTAVRTGVDEHGHEVDEDHERELIAERDDITERLVEMGVAGAGEVSFDAATTFATTCGPCHGEGGAGDGAAAAALDPHPANFTDPAFWNDPEVTRDHEHIVTTIRDGGAAVGRSPLMAAFGAQFDEEQLEAMALFVEGLNPNAE